MDKKKDPRLDNARIMIRTAAPVVAALFLFPQDILLTE